MPAAEEEAKGEGGREHGYCTQRGERESDERSGALNENAVKNFGPPASTDRATRKFKRCSKSCDANSERDLLLSELGWESHQKIACNVSTEARVKPYFASWFRAVRPSEDKCPRYPVTATT